MAFHFWPKSLKRNFAKRTLVEEHINPAAVPDASAPGVARLPGGVSFAVDTVTPAGEAIATEFLADNITQRLQRKILLLPQGDTLVVNPFPQPVDATTGTRRIARRLQHPLIEAIHLAFSQHRPLTLSPDCIWMVIAQGFGHHVNENAETLRGRLVRHRGKMPLTVQTPDLSLNSFEFAITGFSDLIRRHTDPVLYENLVCDFSTTSADVRTASEVAIMDTFSSYFEYVMMCICGIPKITIEGTAEDWRRIRARLEVLATYDLEWWVSRLRPILDEFVLAAEGSPNRDFWKAIYKPKAAYGNEMVTGWMTDLFPYLGDPPQRQRNPVLSQERRDWAIPVEYGISMRTLPPFDHAKDSGVAMSRFPSGLSCARVLVTFPDQTKEEMPLMDGSMTGQVELDILGGFLAIRQDERDLSLSPVIGWCLAELPAKPVLAW